MNRYLLRDAVLTLARSYNFEEGHSLRDELLALRLFDETARLGLHDLDAIVVSGVPAGAGESATEETITGREILSFAAILHDIGYVEGYEGHHKTAFRLVTGKPIPGLPAHGQTLVAHIARYHRGSIPDLAKHTAFAALPAPDRALVEQLGSILRFADGLDRSHTDAVQDLRCELDGDRLVVTLLPGRADETERWAGQKKARWFESVFGVAVTLA